MLEQPAIVMAVGVDEARRERQSVRVDEVVVRIVRPVADGVDAAVDDAHLRGASRRSRPVDDLSVDDKRRGRLRGRVRANESECRED